MVKVGQSRWRYLIHCLPNRFYHILKFSVFLPSQGSWKRRKTYWILFKTSLKVNLWDMYLCMYSCSDTYDDLKTNFYEREGKLLLLLFSAGNSHSESVPQQNIFFLNLSLIWKRRKNILLLFSVGNSHSESVPQQDEVQINIHITLHLRHTFTAQIILNSQTNLESKDFWKS